MLTLHCQGIPGYAGRWLRDTGVKWIKVIDPPEQRPIDFPSDVKIIGRTYMPDNDSNALVRQGAAGADVWFNKWLPFYKSRSYIKIWEGPNEPNPMWDYNLAVGLRDFTIRLAGLMSGAGLTLVGLNFSVGWPYLEEFGDPAPRAKLLGPAVQALHNGGHYIGLHEYSAPTMMNGQGAYCLRYRKTVAEWKSAGYNIPWIIIGECGIDGGVIGRPRTGWKSFATQDGFVTQLVWYSLELDKDPYIVVGCIFTSGPNQDWYDFEVTESLAYDYAKSYYGGVTPDPDPEPPPSNGEMKYFLKDQEANKESFYAVFGNSFVAQQATEGPHVIELRLVDDMDQRAELRGVSNPQAWKMAIDIYGNHFLSEFKLENGRWVAGWGMGHDGWWYNPPAAGPAVIYLQENGQKKGDTVTGGGWFASPYGGHSHANIVYDMSVVPPDPEPEPGVWAKGFYVSEYQGNVDFAKLYTDGYRYVHIRASSGNHKDALFDANWEAAGLAGFLRSAWHFLDPSLPGQAASFKAAVGDRVPELGFYGDFEGSVTLDKCDAFLVAADRNLGTTCNVYTSSGFLGGATPAWAVGRKLWVASWTNASVPVVPVAFGNWEFWQWSSQVSIPGIQNPTLPDRFNGTAQELKDKYGPQEPEPPAEDPIALIDEIIADFQHLKELLI